MAFFTIHKGRIAAVIREVCADVVISANRLAIRLVLVKCRTAGRDIAAAMPLCVAAAADDVGLDPAGGRASQRRGGCRRGYRGQPDDPGEQQEQN
jgi:hypothetical protein